jgi:hypothetical protein
MLASSPANSANARNRPKSPARPPTRARYCAKRMYCKPKLRTRSTGCRHRSSAPRALVAEIEGRASEQFAETEARRTAAAAALAEALATGDPPPTTPPDLNVAETEATAAELRTARAALAQLESEAAAAADRLKRCLVGVARCSLDVLIDGAADEANALIEAAAEVERRRADLDALTNLLRIEGAPAECGGPDPAGANFASDVHSVEFPLTDWRAEFAALCEDHVEGGPVSDTAAPEAP